MMTNGVFSFDTGNSFMFDLKLVCDDSRFGWIIEDRLGENLV